MRGWDYYWAIKQGFANEILCPLTQRTQRRKMDSHSIRAAYESGQLENVIVSYGKTADTIYGLAPDGEYVGLIVGKNGIIITGFSASLEYWQEQ